MQYERVTTRHGSAYAGRPGQSPLRESPPRRYYPQTGVDLYNYSSRVSALRDPPQASSSLHESRVRLERASRLAAEADSLNKFSYSRAMDSYYSNMRRKTATTVADTEHIRHASPKRASGESTSYAQYTRKYSASPLRCDCTSLRQRSPMQDLAYRPSPVRRYPYPPMQYSASQATLPPPSGNNYRPSGSPLR